MGVAKNYVYSFDNCLGEAQQNNPVGAFGEGDAWGGGGRG